MKTIPQHLETISCPLIRAAALRNYDPEFYTNEADCLHYAIRHAFSWYSSPEREDFWNEVYESIRDIKTLPEYPKHLIPEDKMKIDITKKYETREGYEVVIHTDKGREKDHPIVGEIIFSTGMVIQQSWTSEGSYIKGAKNNRDLIEVPELKELWVNEYDSLARVGFPTEENARFYASTGAIRTAVRYVECPEGYEVVKIQTGTDS